MAVADTAKRACHHPSRGDARPSRPYLQESTPRANWAQPLCRMRATILARRRPTRRQLDSSGGCAVFASALPATLRSRSPPWAFSRSSRTSLPSRASPSSRSREWQRRPPLRASNRESPRRRPRLFRQLLATRTPTRPISRMWRERYAAAVFVRAQTPGQENDAEVADALRELRAAEAALDRRTAPTQRALTTALRRYREEGDGVIALADRQRLAIETHAAHLAAIDARLTASVERGFRIFGRVLTREAILQLRADYAVMERAFAAFRTAAAADKEAAVIALADSEAAFERTLTENQREFKRGESPEMVRGDYGGARNAAHAAYCFGR